MVENKNLEKAQKVSMDCIIGNIILTLVKIIIGIFAHSMAMIADAIHSATDIVTTIFVIYGVRISNKPADESHLYGHKKAESIVAKIVAILLMVTAAGIFINGVKMLSNPQIIIPGKIALFAAVLSIVVKEWMYKYTKKVGEEIKSQALIADAWHHRSDAMSSIAAFVGILGAILGFPIMDPIAAIVVGIIICKAAIEIYMSAVKDLMDASPDKRVMNEIETILRDCKDVENIGDIKARQSGNEIYLDVKIEVNKDMSVQKSHEITRVIEQNINDKISDVKEILIHVEPY